MPLHEPAVALTDLALAAEVAVFAVALRRERPAAASTRAIEMQRGFVRSFGWSAVAALTGATLHGLTEQRDDPRREVLWRTSLASIGLASLGTWQSGAALALPADARRWLMPRVTAGHAIYVGLVTARHQEFPVAIAVVAPAAAFLRVALVSRLGHPEERGPAMLALVASAITATAAVVQHRRIALHSRYFDHNATFHTLQGLGYALLLPAARGLVSAAAGRTGRAAGQA
jgi:hypothetical protein